MHPLPSELHLDNISRRLLKTICEDGRITVADAAERAGCSRPTAQAKLRMLEEELGVQRIPELGLSALGFRHRYLIAVKTVENVNRRRLLQIIEKSDIPQFAAVCEGDFNILIYAVARNSADYMRWSYFIRSSLQSGNKVLSWKVSNVVLERLGFFPVEAGILEDVSLSQVQKMILTELVGNATISVSELGGKLKMSPPGAKHHFSTLINAGVIKRFTAVIRKPIGGITVAFFIEKPFLPDHSQRAHRARRMYFRESGTGIANRYWMVSEICGHADQFNLANFRTVEEWLAEKEETVQVFGEGTKIHSGIILDVLRGTLPARYLEIEKVYDMTEWKFEGK